MRSPKRSADIELTHRPEIAVGLAPRGIGNGRRRVARIRIHLQPIGCGNARAARSHGCSEEFQNIAPAEIVPDETISLGGCRVETLHGAVDQRFEAQLARIEAN